MSSYRVRSNIIVVVARYFLASVFSSFVLVVSAQQHSYPVLTTTDSPEVWFDRIVNPNNAAIINGPEYHLPFSGYRSHPFYQRAESQRSIVRYDNDLYTNLDLLYDTYGDILVLKWPTTQGTFLIKLDKDLVQGFDLYQHHFKKIKGGTMAKGGNYFDVLFEAGEFAILAKRLKVERIEGIKKDYVENDLFYILDQGQWTRITGKNSFAKVVEKDKRKELSRFIKSNHIKLRKRTDEDLAKVGAFCYSLKKKG